MRLTRITALAGDTILPLADAKAHLRVTHTDEDTLIGALRDAAISHVERISGVPLAPSEYRWTMAWFCAAVALPVHPVTLLGEITYHDELGDAATYTGARLVDGAVFPMVGESWPDANGYAAVTFTAGLTDASEAPGLLAAVMLMLGHLYANREAVNVGSNFAEVPLGVDALIHTYRRVLV